MPYNDEEVDDRTDAERISDEAWEGYARSRDCFAPQSRFHEEDTRTTAEIAEDDAWERYADGVGPHPRGGILN